MGATAEVRIDHLRKLGAEVVPVLSDVGLNGDERDLRSRLRRIVSPKLSDLYPQVVDGDLLREAVASSDCDVAFVYHWDALAASRKLEIPRIAGVGDPSQLPRLYRWRDALPSTVALRSTLQLQGALRRYPVFMRTLLEECATYGAFAAHHAEWLREHGASRCLYLRTPVPDEAGLDWAEERALRDRGERPRLLLLGHLAGIVTINGLRVFRRMLPELDRLFGRDGYAVDVVGGYDPPPDLQPLFDHPAVNRHGHTDDAPAWLRRTDALLVPTSIPLGIRVRIITGLSFGTPIVSHRANALGIPELEDGVNCLLGDTPEQLAAAAWRLARDPELQATLGRGARATYERYFTPEIAGGRVIDLLEAAM